MTKYVLIISLGLIFLSLISCTHNDGGEQKIYGTWKLKRISVAGKDDPAYTGNIFWKFQNKTIEMQQVDELHNSWQTFGNYRLADQTLFLSFPDTERPPLLELPRESEFQIVKLKGKEMVLATGDPATIYYFEKW